VNAIEAARDATTTRLAALDVGTNSIRLIVAEAKADGTYKLLDDEKETGRLGRGMSSSGALASKAMEDAAVVIARMKDIAAGYGVQKLRSVGTCAVREAVNQKEFLDLVQARAGLDLEVVSAEEEARLAFLSVSHAFDLRQLAAAVVDIGGGSTEVVLSSGGVIEQISTLPLGAVRLTEQFDMAENGDERAFDAMCSAIKKTISQRLEKPTFTPQLLIGTGGTFTALAAIAMHWGRDELGGGSDSPAANVRGYEIQRSMVKHLLGYLRTLSPKARARVPGLSPERAEIIIAGIAIVDGLMRKLKVNTLRVHDRGIRDGLLLSMIRELYPQARQAAASGPNRMNAVRQFALSCNYEKAHSDHVTALAVQVFDQLAAQRPGAGAGAQTASEAWSRPLCREILEAAGLLHDVGYYINYAKHHKHSYHLIVHSELPGFTHREIEIIANVARYHRRANPKPSHANFANLPEVDQQIVLKLSAILRIVDGLDRAHAQIVKSVRVEVRKGTARFIVHAGTEPAVDIWGAERKCKLFKRGFGLEPRFEWAGAKLHAASARAKLSSASTA
jgi:exopolyphosphatase/guanosine-5'-triphosphate,3'-diphosphate pyrophosphatase